MQKDKEERILCIDPVLSKFNIRRLSKLYYRDYGYTSKQQMLCDRKRVGIVHLYVEAHGLGLSGTGVKAFGNISEDGKDAMSALVNQKSQMKPVTSDIYDSYTPLQLAVLFDIPYLVEFFLSNADADVGVEDADGRDLFLLSIVHGITSVQFGSTLHHLLRFKNIDVNSRCNTGYTALHYCFFDHRHDCRDVAVNLINKWGGDVEAREATGKTPLQVALYMNTLEQVKFLVDYLDADVHCVCYEGWTALHSVCANPDSRAQNPSEIFAVPKLRYLLYEKGLLSAVNVADKEGVTPLHVACFACGESRGSSSCVEELMVVHARYDAVDNDFSAPLSDVIASGNINALHSIFLRAGTEHAKLEIIRRDKYGRNALHLACHFGWLDMLHIFILVLQC